MLRGVDLDITSGSTVAMVGSSGAGKSTFVDILLGLHRPTAGSVTAGGISVFDNLPAWQRQLAVVPQDVTLLDESLRANIAFDEELDDARMAEAVERAQLGDLVRALPQGLDTEIGERGVRLSGGQRQRIGIARALYRRPSLLVLDEATSALDNETERRLTETIESLNGTMTMVIVAHRLSTVRHADQLIFMSEGTVATVGTFEEVAAENDEFAHLWRWASWQTRARIVAKAGTVNVAAACSVVIPTYNAATGDRAPAACARRTAGTAPPFEVVVADNESTDDLEDVRSASGPTGSTSASRRRLARAQGCRSARNVGIEHARTDRISRICDADDVVAPWAGRRAFHDALDQHALASGPVETALLSGRSAAWVPVDQQTTGLFETWAGRTYGIGCNSACAARCGRPSAASTSTTPPARRRSTSPGARGTSATASPTSPTRCCTTGSARTCAACCASSTTPDAARRRSTRSSVPPRSARSRCRGRIHHELLLLRQFPWRGSADDRRELADADGVRGRQAGRGAAARQSGPVRASAH